jgi:hypothetical protein
MSIFSDFIDGIDSLGNFFAGNGNGNGNGHGAAGGDRAGRGRIERLCRQLKWEVDERDGDAIILHFDHREVGRRSVRILGGDEDLVLFAAYSHAFPPADRVPHEVLGYLLGQTKQASVGGWCADVDKDGDAIFCLLYRALGDGLNHPASLKFICEGMIRQVIAFDAKMRAAGLL